MKKRKNKVFLISISIAMLMLIQPFRVNKASAAEGDYKPIDVSGIKAKTKKDIKEEVVNGTFTGSKDDLDALAKPEAIADFSKSQEGIDKLLNWVKKVSNITLGFAIIGGLGGIVYLFICLGIYSSNPSMRATVIKKLSIVCIATAAATMVGVFFNIFMQLITTGL